MTNPSRLQFLENLRSDLSKKEIVFPTFLDITFKVRSALKDPNVNVAKLATLIGAEPMMSTKILRVANSATMNTSGQKISDLQRAISKVGLETVRSISFAVAMEQMTKSRQMRPFEKLSQRLWEHTVFVAALCRMLARQKAKGTNVDEAMFCGLVHDIGVFYLLSRLAQYPEIVADPAVLDSILVEWHANVGYILLKAMGLSEDVMIAVKEHETPREVQDTLSLSDVVYIANLIADMNTPWREIADSEDFNATTKNLLTVFLGETYLQELIDASTEEALSLKAALSA